jgi:hypothetical protein
LEFLSKDAQFRLRVFKDIGEYREKVDNPGNPDKCKDYCIVERQKFRSNTTVISVKHHSDFGQTPQ